MSSFERFVAIDWSGAKGERHKGIQVAICERGTAAPALLSGPSGRHWSRQEICDLIGSFSDCRTLVGIDFAFAYSFADYRAYFPNILDSPRRATALWELIEEIAADAPNLYGGPVFQSESSPLRSVYWSRGPKPDWFQLRPRITEQHATAIAKPNSPFQTFGPANVGTGSLAGMRMLHRLYKEIPVWPFSVPGNTTVVEIFPTFLVRKAGVDNRRLYLDQSRISSVLNFYNTEPFVGGSIDTEDKADAVVAAAALRRLSDDPTVWSAPAREPASRHEGWIFGVT
ncbi:hypothetical protein [Thalassobaculum salexigens]|uniref:hypothetical protein n=1 Tax=Thalassobaculum salexigens TaxID=455360 RepID=UPI0012EC8D1D|nr:hypothetical protein [Thalassobaculum salexigens]